MPYFGENKDHSELAVLNDAILDEIQSFASRGLTKEEILMGYTLNWDDLSFADKKAFDERFNYGRIVGVKAMSDSLFLQAKGRNGTAAALAYLLRFGANFPPMSDGSQATITIKDETGRNVIPDVNVKIT
jgi:hypothetical protein